jgi:hypothetical protein
VYAFPSLEISRPGITCELLNAITSLFGFPEDAIGEMERKPRARSEGSSILGRSALDFLSSVHAGSAFQRLLAIIPKGFPVIRSIIINAKPCRTIHSPLPLQSNEREVC